MGKNVKQTVMSIVVKAFGKEIEVGKMDLIYRAGHDTFPYLKMCVGDNEVEVKCIGFKNYDFGNYVALFFANNINGEIEYFFTDFPVWVKQYEEFKTKLVIEPMEHRTAVVKFNAIDVE